MRLIASTTLNPAGFNVNTMWFGFSYQYVRDDVVQTPVDRFELARDVFAWMQNAVNLNVTPAETPKSTKLAQNFPNPFNPSTTIKFDLKDKGIVTLKVYNVAGQLVRTLVNGVKDAKHVHGHLGRQERPGWRSGEWYLLLQDGYEGLQPDQEDGHAALAHTIDRV